MVSIIILTYNSARHIKNLLDSIIRFNKNSEYEIIIVDNNSKDDTVKLVSSFNSRIKFVENKENVGSQSINIERGRPGEIRFVYKSRYGMEEWCG